MLWAVESGGALGEYVNERGEAVKSLRGMPVKMEWYSKCETSLILFGCPCLYVCVLVTNNCRSLLTIGRRVIDIGRWMLVG